ncbi:hypothetical protein H5410_001284 [Solanum commersonii]|uniref:Uncharacterized protein n=1 Tax=Solanum commersonii TaxID=4109 RepID=A0A9J6AZP1_SOLCO|nr:hypothetical protein H5410_001284 [Solanum commersonii]
METLNTSAGTFKNIIFLSGVGSQSLNSNLLAIVSTKSKKTNIDKVPPFLFHCQPPSQGKSSKLGQLSLLLWLQTSCSNNLIFSEILVILLSLLDYWSIINTLLALQIRTCVITNASPSHFSLTLLIVRP